MEQQGTRTQGAGTERAPVRTVVGQGAKAAVGAFGEQLVADRLSEQGWRVLERNWRSRARDCPGELDLLALDPDDVLVVVEVRTRRGDSCGTALESVTPGKLRRLRRLFGVWWAGQEPASRVRHAGGARIDVVAVQLRAHGPSRLTHVRGGRLMGLGRTLCAALVGLDGHVVEVEAHVSPGLVQWVVVGLPDTGVLEARDRVRSALVASRQAPPQARVTVNLSPAGLPKSGTAFDLGVAVSVLAAVGVVPASVASVGHVGELGLDGAVRSVPGVLPAVLGLVRAGVQRVVVSRGDAEEARLVPGVEVLGVGCLAEAVALHRGEPWDEAGDAPADNGRRAPARPFDLAVAPDGADLSDVVGQPMGRRAVEVVAAGGHHLLMLGPPGSGKTMLAARLPGLLPDLDDADALTATAVHSLAGTLVVPRLLRRPPFEAPHHTASVSAVVGGGTGLPRPGAASRAHAGVLFLDECPEFRRGVLDALRQPLEQGVVEVQRAKGVARLPARFQLVMAANPCPCGNASAGERGARCTCPARTRRAYLQRLSGPLLDRVDVQVEVPAVTAARWADPDPGESTAVVAHRVVEARGAARARWGARWPTNVQVPGTVLRSTRHRPPARVLAPLLRGVDRGTLTARGYDRALRVAWSIADLAGSGVPGADEVAEAVSFRTLASLS